jgi:hypothetical protein
MPPSFEECTRNLNASKRSKRYDVEASSRAFFVYALEAKRAKRLPKRLRSSQPSVELPAENIAAIKLLDSWLAIPETDSGERADGIRRRIDENRLSDRKFFT